MFDSATAINWQDFHFLRPGFLWLLLPAALTLVLGLMGSREQVKWKSIIAPHLRPYIIQKGSEKIKKQLQLVVFVFTSFAILGLSGPTVKKIEIPGQILETPAVILMDLSQTMLADDIQPSRLERAKFKIRDFLDEKPGVRIALIGYAGTAHTVVPLTNDYSIIASHVNSLSPEIMPMEGNNLAAALNLADTLTRLTTAPGTVLLFSDDFSDESFTLLQQYVGQGKNKIEIVAMNTAGDSELMKRIASVEGITMNILTLDKSDMELLAKRISSNLEFKEEDEEKEDDWQDEGLWFAIPFTLLVLIWFRKGWVIYSLLIMLSFSSCSGGGTVSDWWLTRDFQAQQHFDRGEFEEAAQLYEDPLHRGVAYFKSGDYEKAIAAFEEDTSAMAAYNLGLAYYKNGDYAAAGLAFGLAAEMDPELPDARRNQELMQQHIAGTDEGELGDATESGEEQVAQNIENTGPEDLSGGGQEATEEDMKKERKEETAATDMRKGKELDELPPDFEPPGQKDDSQKVLMRKVDDDPALFLKRKFQYQVKKNKLKPVKDGTG